MIEVRTLLRLPDGAFIQVDACGERPRDAQYVEGAIELIADGVQILSVAEWDYIDQLWSYVADMIRELPKQGEASTYFPDQPIMLKFLRSSPGRLLVSCRVGDNVRQANVNESEFLAAIRSAGQVFFEKMSRLLPENSQGYDIARHSLTA
ncbi:hypothetical protein [Streptomyces sp. SID1034]|uniref:hypothetical protein n=1 Tax=Streptomyces TaxID=1883 RepID=UPI001368CC3F|nr:hypothetical protein [Streptomyces sp. SID1034]MYV95268.1 hypothetical protein [Streptomyces sp. SID1034]